MTIDRFYRPTMDYPPPNSNKEYGPTFHWRAPRRGPLIVFHPEFQFDPHSPDIREVQILARDLDRDLFADPEQRMTPPFVPSEGNEVQILHESFRTKSRVHDVIQAFIETYPYLSGLQDDETGWWNTGFWSARRGNENCIGISEPPEDLRLPGTGRGEFAYVLCNNSTILELTSGATGKTTAVDAYLNNRSIPWAEMRRAISSTLDTVGPWDSIKKEFTNKTRISEGMVRRNEMMHHHHQRMTSTLKPIAVARIMSTACHSAIVEWKFGMTPWTEFDSMRYALASIGPHMELNDFADKMSLGIRYFYPFFLSHCVVVDCALSRTRDI